MMFSESEDQFSTFDSGLEAEYHVSSTNLLAGQHKNFSINVYCT